MHVKEGKNKVSAHVLYHNIPHTYYKCTLHVTT